MGDGFLGPLWTGLWKDAAGGCEGMGRDTFLLQKDAEGLWEGLWSSFCFRA